MKIKGLIIISGGQAGTDRAALDFAIKYGLCSSGWCPKGRLAEDGIIADKYPLKETATAEPSERTRFNIEESDASLIIYKKIADTGTLFTIQYATDMAKQIIVSCQEQEISTQSFRKWLQENKVQKLNVAGPRESKDEGVYEYSLETLCKLLGNKDMKDITRP